MSAITVVILTYYRPDPLRRAIQSCLAQQKVDGCLVEIVVVDNSPDATASVIVESMQLEAARKRILLRFVHEPRPGISHGRNAGVRAAAGDLVAFLDDDEEAEPNWLICLYYCLNQTGADLVLGPVYPRFERVDVAHDTFWLWCFTYDYRSPSGGNCLLRKTRCCLTDEPFDPSFGLTGGEDSWFFLCLRRSGRHIAWCAEAKAYEHHPATRTTLRYILKRHLRLGQNFVRQFSQLEPPDLVSIAKWMTIGAVQATLFSTVASLLWGFDRLRARKLLVKAANGFGKVCWVSIFAIKEYGLRR